MSRRARSGAGPATDQPVTRGGDMEQSTLDAKTVDYETAKQTLLAIASENPDWVDPRSDPENHDGCRYVAGGNPSCIVGHAIYLLTPLDADEVMKSIEAVEKDDCSPSMEEAMRIGGLQLDEKARVLMGDVQQNQDCGDTWRRAVDRVLRDIEG